MKVTVLLAIALTIAFATAALPRPQEADGTSKLILPPRISTSTGSVSGTGTLLGATPDLRRTRIAHFRSACPDSKQLLNGAA